MATITVYSFEDKDGNPDGCWETQDYAEAKAHAQKYKLRIIGNEYEWTEAIPLDDYTGADVDDDERELRDAWEGEGNSSRVTFEDWVSDMAENPHGTLKDAAREFLGL